MTTRFLRVLLLIVSATMSVTANASAQRTDSARVSTVAPKPKVDTVRDEGPKAPLSPQRAFLYSLAIPGFAQSRLGRPTGGAIFVFNEALGIAMLREAAAELREARRFRTDSLVFIGNDPITGAPVMQQSAFNDGLVSIRRGHVEDWIAFVLANHLFAGADAYVAAHLWDLPTQIKVAQTPTGTVIVANIRW